MGLAQILKEEEDNGKITFTAITEDGNTHSVSVFSSSLDSAINAARDEAIEGALKKD